MKNLFFFVILQSIISSCVSLNTELLKSSNDYLSPRLPYLEITSNRAGYTSEIEFNTEEKLYSLFKSEMKECIISSPTKEIKGYLKPIIKSTTEIGGLGLAYLSGLTLGALNLIGMPYGNFTTELSLQLYIVDENEKNFWSGTYSSSKVIWSGLYYNGLNQACINNTSLRMFKELLREVRKELSYDYKKIISDLN
tara:strand:- start:1800 stop:2384 length:585 start_codon:yes stop_codon:yes gene_type:complete